MRQAEVKRQHYVPRSYLKHFSTGRSGEYYVKALPNLDCKEGRIFELNISNICLENDLYTLPGDNPKDKMLLEKFYADNYEKHYNKIYDVLIDPSKKVLNDQERELIISTVVIMFYRTTKLIKLHNNFSDRVLERIYTLCKETGKDYYIFEGQRISIKGKTLEQLQKENKNDSKPSQVIAQIEKALELINLRIKNDGIFVTKLMDQNSEFITSDNPVICYNTQATHIMPFDPSNILKLPLDNKHMLYLMPYSNQETKLCVLRQNIQGTMCLSEEQVSNFEQFKNSERFLIGSNNSLKRYLATI